MTSAEAIQAVKDWLNGEVTGVEPVITVIEANQNAPRPARPYITALVTSTKQKEHASESAPDDDCNAIIENDNMVMVSLQCFGDNSKSIMEGIRNSLNKVSVKQALRAAGLPYIRTLNGVNDLTEVIGTKFEARAGMDLEFRCVSSVTDFVGVIESVEITGTTDTKTIYENTIEVGA